MVIFLYKLYIIVYQCLLFSIASPYILFHFCVVPFRVVTMTMTSLLTMSPTRYTSRYILQLVVMLIYSVPEVCDVSSTVFY